MEQGLRDNVSLPLPGTDLKSGPVRQAAPPDRCASRAADSKQLGNCQDRVGDCPDRVAVSGCNGSRVWLQGFVTIGHAEQPNSHERAYTEAKRRSPNYVQHYVGSAIDSNAQSYGL
jgi:hypothetical protein